MVLLCVSYFSNAQVKTKHQPYFDDKSPRFGFMLGYGKTNYNIKQTADFLVSSQYIGIQSPQNSFIHLGGIINYNLANNWDFRVVPTVSIYSRDFVATNADGTEETDLSQKDKAWFEIPVFLKFKSNRRSNHRAYLMAGFKYGIQTNALGKGNADAASIKNSDFCLEYALGFEAINRYFKFGPELHFSHGLKNMINNTSQTSQPDNPLSDINRLTTNTISLQLTFE